MKTQVISYKKIIRLFPCYDPVDIGMPKNYEASIIDFIEEYRTKVVEKNDIVWVLLREDYLSDKELRLFAVWCARQVQHLMKDERSIKAIDVAEKFATGEASKADLTEANAAAFAAYAYADARAAYATDANAAKAAAWATDADANAAKAAAWATDADATAANAAANAVAAADRTAKSDAVLAAAYAARIDRLLEIFKSRFITS
tara:strand:+ start:601 stop:1209 length:609 start_codon:yes stop_codon:yes gene_type:complete